MRYYATTLSLMVAAVLIFVAERFGFLSLASPIDGAAFIYIPTALLLSFYLVMLRLGRRWGLFAIAGVYTITGAISYLIGGMSQGVPLIEAFEPLLIVWLVVSYRQNNADQVFAKTTLYYCLSAVFVTVVFSSTTWISNLILGEMQPEVMIHSVTQRFLSHLAGYFVIAPFLLVTIANCQRGVGAKWLGVLRQTASVLVIMGAVILTGLLASSLDLPHMLKVAAPWSLLLLAPVLIYTAYRTGFLTTCMLLAIGALLVAGLTSMGVGTLADVEPNSVRLLLAITGLSALMILSYVSILGTALQEAERAVEAKNRFLASMGHELRSCLTGVVGATELLKLEIPNGIDANDRIGLIRRTGGLMSRLIDDAVGYAQIGDGSIELESVDFILADAARDCVHLIKGQVAAKGLGLIVKAEDFEGVPIRADRARIQQVIINLLSNAAKFTDEGEITLSLKAQPIADQFIVCEIEVADTGSGVPVDERSKVFEAFTRSKPSQGGGLGLGLAISNDIARAMKGSITICDNEPRGAVFTFKFVAEQIPRIQEDFSRKTRLEQGRDFNVLVADDNHANRMILNAMLEAVGLSVTSVENGAAALNAVKQMQFDLILLDMHMPKMNGAATIVEIRKHMLGHLQTPVLIVTGDEAPDTYKELRGLGAVDIVAKPYSAERLIGAVNDALAHRVL